MSSELRVNKLTSRSGVGTVTFNDSGLIITGIATAATLDITGNATIAGVLSYDDVTNVDSVGLITARSGLRVVGTASSIGVGVANPAEKIDVAGSIQSDTGLKVAGHPVVGYGNLGGGEYAARLGSTGSSTLNKTQIYARGAHVATFDGASGNVGVGEQTPDVRLHITETIDVAYSVANATDDANNLLKLENPSTTANAFAGIQFRTGSGADMFFGAIQQSVNHGDFFFANQNSPQREMMRIKSTGKIGVGTDDPRYSLEVYDSNALVSGSSAGTLILEDRGVADGARPFALLASNGGDFTFTNSNRNASGTTTSSVERLRISSNGVIQLSNGNLITAANSTTYISVTGGSSTADGANFFVYGGSHASNPGAFVLRSGTSEKLRVTSTGQFGLGTATPVTDVDISQKTGAVALPQGTTAQRPSGSAPYIRKNTTNNALEYYDGTSWVEIITDYFPTGSTILG